MDIISKYMWRECVTVMKTSRSSYLPDFICYKNVALIISGVRCGDIVSVFADTVGQCKKGFQKRYTHSSKIFLGNGIVHMERKHLYAKDLKPV